MTFSEVKKGLLDKMKKVFPENKYHYYSTAVVENYDRPCFFTQLHVIGNKPETYNSRKIQAAFYIDYRQKENDEADNLQVAEKLQEVFGFAVIIKERAIDVTDVTWDFVGKNRNILEVEVGLEWSKNVEHPEDAPMIESAEFNSRLEE